LRCRSFALFAPRIPVRQRCTPATADYVPAELPALINPLDYELRLLADRNGAGAAAAGKTAAGFQAGLEMRGGEVGLT
jgi:hypothetical protein